VLDCLLTNVNQCPSLDVVPLPDFSIPFMIMSIDDDVRYLRFVLVPSLSPKIHVDRVTCRAVELFCSLKIISDEFNLSDSLKTLFCALGRPVLGFFVWNPHAAVFYRQVERVQREFLSFVGFKSNVLCTTVTLSSIS